MTLLSKFDSIGNNLLALPLGYTPEQLQAFSDAVAGGADELAAYRRVFGAEPVTLYP